VVPFFTLRLLRCFCFGSTLHGETNWSLGEEEEEERKGEEEEWQGEREGREREPLLGSAELSRLAGFAVRPASVLVEQEG